MPAETPLAENGRSTARGRASAAPPPRALGRGPSTGSRPARLWPPHRVVLPRTPTLHLARGDADGAACTCRGTREGGGSHGTRLARTRVLTRTRGAHGLVVPCPGPLGHPFNTARPGPIVSRLALGAPQGSTRRGDGAVCQETWAPAWSRPCVPTVGRAIAYQAPQDPAQPRDRAVLPLGCRGPREPPGSLTPVPVGLRLGSVCVPPTGPSMD